MWSLMLVWVLAVFDASGRADAAATAPLRLTVDAYSSAPSRVGVGVASASELQVRQVWLAFRDVRFRPAADCAASGPSQAPAPASVELVHRKVIGLVERVALAPGRYCALELALRRVRARDEGVPADMRGHSIIVAALRGDGIRVVVRSRLVGAVRLAATDERGFAVPPDGLSTVLALDVGAWIGGLDFATAEVSLVEGTRTIVIDERNNRALLDELERSFAASLGLFHDRDDDRRAGERERAEPLAMGGRSGPATSTPAR